MPSVRRIYGVSAGGGKPYAISRFSLSGSSFSPIESSTLNVTVSRSGSSLGSVSVNWALTGMSEGAPGTTSGTLTWSDGDSASKTISLAFGAVTVNQYATLTLSSPVNNSGGITPALVTPYVASITVRDSASPAGATADTFSIVTIKYPILTDGAINQVSGAWNWTDASWGQPVKTYIVPDGETYTSASAVYQTVGGANTYGGGGGRYRQEFTVTKGSLSYGPVNIYTVTNDNSIASYRQRAWFNDPAKDAKLDNGAGPFTAFWAHDIGEKVWRHERPATTGGIKMNHGLAGTIKSKVYDGTKASIKGWRNERVFLAFCLENGGSTTSNVTFEVSAFTRSGGGTITSPTRTASQCNDYYISSQQVCVETFVAGYTEVRGVSSSGAIGYSYGKMDPASYWELPYVRRPEAALDPYIGEGKWIADQSPPDPGSWPDLTFEARPEANKWVPDEMRYCEAHGNVTIAANESQEFYLKVWIPDDATTGLYTATVTVKVSGTTTLTMPVELTVGTPTTNTTWVASHTKWLQLGGAFRADFIANRMYLGGTNLDITTASGSVQTQWSNATYGALRMMKRFGLDASDTWGSVTNPVGWTGEWDGPRHAAQFDGTFFTNANKYSGPGTSVGACIHWSSPYSGFRFWPGINNNTDAYNPEQKTISSVSKTNPVVITTSTAHGSEDGTYNFCRGFTGQWAVLNDVPRKVTVINSTQYSVPLDASGFTDNYTSGATAYIGLKPSGFWAKLDSFATWAATSTNTMAVLQMFDETFNLHPENASVIKAALLVRDDNTGIGKNAKFMTTVVPALYLAGYAGLNLDALPVIWTGYDRCQSEAEKATNTANIAELKSRCETYVYGSDTGDYAWRDRTAWTTMCRLYMWAAWLGGNTRLIFWFINQWYNSGMGGDSLTMAKQLHLFTRSITFGAMDTSYDECGEYGSNYINLLGDGMLVYPGRDAVYSEAAVGADICTPSLRLALMSRGLDDVEIFQKASTIVGRPTVEALVRKIVHVQGPEQSDIVAATGSTPGLYFCSKQWCVSNPDYVDDVLDQIRALI